MIKFSEVSKRFGDLLVLDKVDLEIEPKEFVFVIGPTGAGKTTLIKLLLREFAPTTGSIKVGEFDLEELKPSQVHQLRKKIGVVFQDLKLLQDRTIKENVGLALKIFGKKEAEIEKEIKNVLDLVSLADRADYFPRQLSGGELQRTCLARAIIGQPEIVIADEPTGNVDPATTWQMIKLLREINRLGKTVIVATHNFEVVNSLKKRVIELDKGKLVSDKKKGQYKIK